MCQSREVEMCHGVVEEERFPLPHVPLHEGDPALGCFAVDGTPRLEVVGLHSPGRLTGPPFPDVGNPGPGGIEALEGGELRRMTRARNAPPLIESLLRRFPPTLPVGSANVPLSKEGRRVAKGLEGLGDRYLPQCHPRGVPLTRANGQAAREQRNAGNDT